MGRFETKWLSRPENLAALADLPGQWIDKVHQQRPPKVIVLDMPGRATAARGATLLRHFQLSGTELE